MPNDIDSSPDVQTTSDTSRSLPQWLHDQVASAWSYEANGMKQGYQDVASLVKEGADLIGNQPWENVQKVGMMLQDTASNAKSVLPTLFVDGAGVVAGAAAGGPIGATAAALLEANIGRSPSTTVK